MSHHKVFTPLLVLVSAVIFLDTTFYSVLTPLLPHYLNRGGFSSNTIGLLVGAYAVGTIVGIAPSSMFSTWIGPKATVIAGLILMSISTFAFARLTSPDLLVACRLVQGLAGAAAWSGGLAWVASNTPASQIGQSIGVVFAASGTGSMLGPVIGAIAIHHGIALTFSMSAWLIVAITLATPFIRPTHLAVVERSNPAVSFWKRKRSRGFRQALAFTALSGAGFGTYQVLGPIKMTHLGASPDTIAATFLMASAIQIVMGPLSGRITDRGGGTVVVVAALGCGVIGCLLARMSRSPWIFG
jgi:MFS family permease